MDDEYLIKKHILYKNRRSLHSYFIWRELYGYLDDTEFEVQIYNVVKRSKHLTMDINGLITVIKTTEIPKYFKEIQ